MKNIVIVDIDGTLAKVHPERLKFLQEGNKDWDAFYAMCHKDEPIEEVCKMINILAIRYDIIFCTGRRDSERYKTKLWLKKHLGRWAAKSKLFMRKTGDLRHDTIVKPELLDNGGIPLSEIAFILEDRNSMVAKWRELGLICLQVAEGDF